ncbi:MAG: nucleotidyltransferase domain-containing protein [Oscillospiraceae bacterium]|nr:nucleotidyltransferase domain-containing protein [Oscillospiraceae bacterium]
MNIGLSHEQIGMIVGLIKKEGASRAVVFGSRAKGNWRNNSDIDIAVFGSGVNMGSLCLQLDELPMPYKFDVIGYDDITHMPLREHINRIGVEIYAKK